MQDLYKIFNEWRLGILEKKIARTEKYKDTLIKELSPIPSQMKEECNLCVSSCSNKFIEDRLKRAETGLTEYNIKKQKLELSLENAN